MIEDLKKQESTQSSMDEPSYDDDELGATMMDITKGPKKPQNKVIIPKEEKEESVDELLKKQKSLIGRLGNIFGKK